MREILHKYKYIFSRAHNTVATEEEPSKQIIFSGPMPGLVSGFTWTPCAPTRKADGSETASGGGKASATVYFIKI